MMMMMINYRDSLTKMSRSQSDIIDQIQGLEITLIKGKSNDMFVLQFFLSFEPARATDHRVKIFSILVRILPNYLIFFSSDFLLPQG